MNKNGTQPDFEKALKMNNKFLALFYASWCPFSRKFLPIYQKCTKNNPFLCLQVMVDDQEELCEQYDINYYPTVLVFEQGTVTRRLDAEPGEGLSEKQLKKLLQTLG